MQSLLPSFSSKIIRFIKYGYKFFELINKLNRKHTYIHIYIQQIIGNLIVKLDKFELCLMAAWEHCTIMGQFLNIKGQF